VSARPGLHAPPGGLLRWVLQIGATQRSIAGGRGHRGPVSDHFDGNVFFNREAGTGRGLRDFVRWQRTSRPTPWPDWVENRAVPRLPRELAPGALALTFVNHITFLLQFRGLNVLTDPVWSERVSPVQWTGPKRVRAPGLPFEQLPRIDIVLVSHNHYDHLDLDTLRRLEAQHHPWFVTGLGNRSFLQDHGLARVTELDWWQAAHDGGARIVYTPAQHWSGRSLRGRNHTLWGGFVLEHSGRSVYFAGDTGYARHFAEIRERCGTMDVALLPIGAYEPRWFMQEQHMNPDDAVRAHLDLQPRLSIGSHFGCFQLTDEGIDDPLIELAAARERHGVSAADFRVLETGETLELSAAVTVSDNSASETVTPTPFL
jgi:L-ascorbate metabolism protein UlaG (beta-lactamase superfamily)